MTSLGDKIGYIIDVKYDSIDDYQFDENSLNINSEYMKYKIEVPDDMFENGTFKDNKTIMFAFSNNNDSSTLLE